MSPPTRRAFALGTLFGAFAFLQTIAEPTDGLAAQPVQSMLMRRGGSVSEDGAYAALIALPWSFKPLYGLLVDAVPIRGRRRQGYLILGGTVAALLLFALGSRPVAIGWMVGGLALTTAAIALTDVASDALLIDQGRLLGRIGPLQAAQWGSAYAAGIAIGQVGGQWSAGRREDRALLACALASAGIALLAVIAVREPRAVAGDRPGFRDAARAFRRAIQAPELWRVGGFLFLWNFNPFSNFILRRHLIHALGYDEVFYGWTHSLTAVASILACLAYAPIAVRVPFPILARASVVLGVASTLLYGGLGGPESVLAVTVVVGFVYMLATLIQLDLAARSCPPGATAAVFATFMALENLAAALSISFGGWCYERASAPWGEVAAFRLLVFLGAATTAASWTLLPSDRSKAEVSGSD